MADKTTSIPEPARWALGAIGVTVPVGAAAWWGWKTALLALGIVLLLGLLIFGAYWIYCRARLRRKAKIDEELIGVIWEKLREGLKTIGKKQLDFHRGGELPWYLVIGMPASGKTMLLANSGVLVEQLNPWREEQDGSKELGFRGDGGTKGMNFLFAKFGKSKYAVILDTAGALLMGHGTQKSSMDSEGGAKGGADPEDSLKSETWSDFLRKLKKAHPRVPINGLLLFVPVDYLASSSLEQIRINAGLIGKRINELRDELGIRFPLYLIVSKCDLMVGFREFTQRLYTESNHSAAPPEDRLEDQIFGWSYHPENEDLDKQVDENDVDKWVEGVAERVHTRLVSWFRNPANPINGVRGAHDYDAIFALPQALRDLAPKLREYLNKLLEMEDISEKPVFFRGFYFTSALRQNTVFDVVLARSLNVSLDELRIRYAKATGDVDQNEAGNRAYFIQHLFTRKIFPERLLVTDASNIKRLKRNRLIAAMSISVGALLLLLGIAWHAQKQFKYTLGTERDYWNVGANWATSSYWPPIIVQSPGGQQYRYAGADIIKEIGTSLEDYHVKIFDISTTNLKIPPVFKLAHWFVDDFSEDRRNAQRIIFERSLVFPLVIGVRKKMESDPGAVIEISPHDWTSSLTRALTALLDLEKYGQYSAHVTNGSEYINAFNYYLAITNPVSSNIVRVWNGVYGGRPPRTGAEWHWPPKGLAKGATNLADYPSINNGLRLLLNNVTNNLSAATTNLHRLKTLQNMLIAYATNETGYLSSVGTGDYSTINLAWLSLSNCFSNLDNNEAAKYSDQALNMAYESISSNAFLKTSEDLNKLLKPIKAAGDSMPIGNEITQKVAQALQDIKRRAEIMDKEFLERTTNYALDSNILTNRSYYRRFELYKVVMGASQSPVPSGLEYRDLVGKEWQPLLQKASNHVNILATYSSQYSGPLSNNVNELVVYISRYYNTNLFNMVVDEYCRAARQLLTNRNIMTLNNITNIATELINIDKDISAGKRMDVISNWHKIFDEITNSIAQKRRELGSNIVTHINNKYTAIYNSNLLANPTAWNGLEEIQPWLTNQMICMLLKASLHSGLRDHMVTNINRMIRFRDAIIDIDEGKVRTVKECTYIPIIKDGWLDYYKYNWIRIGNNDKNEYRTDLTNKIDDIIITNGFTVSVIEKDNGATNTLTHNIFKMLAEYCEPGSGGAVWEVQYSMPKIKQKIKLNIELYKPLPKTNEWPPVVLEW
ncbi:MAG: hypothetical protein N3J91_04140 [Verrucomicrobiae bacterium]|nr:hypothetical protein [Verrucomicrobiae bacterium]